jgi:serine/threonine protein kinase
MESGKSKKTGYGCLCSGWLPRLIDRACELYLNTKDTAHLTNERPAAVLQSEETGLDTPEIESLKTELWAAASKQETSNLEKAQVRKKPTASVEILATTPTNTVISVLQTIMNMPHLHNPSSLPAEVADRIQKLEDELWEKEQCLTKLMDQVTSQLMQFKKDIQVKDKVISDLEKKLNAQTQEGTEASLEHSATIMTDRAQTTEAICSPGRVGASHFESLRVLGIGGSGTVTLARKKGGIDDGRLYAIKALQKASITEDEVIEHTMTERRVLEAVRQHPFLSTLHYAFQTDSKLYLVLDYKGGGNLLTYSYCRIFTEDAARFYISETILALEHLHKLGIIHRDVKQENILIDLQGHVVLSDFGLSKMFLPYEKHIAYSWCGTLSNMAPELAETCPDGYDRTVDWWSLGIVTYELLTGWPPFERERESETREETARRINTEQPYIPGHLSPDAKHFISKLLIKNPRERLGGGKDDADELKRHPFLKGINWSDLAQKKILAPIAPKITDELDVSNFPDKFTEMIPDDSAVTLPPNCDKRFRGYSYASPSFVCSE